MIVVLDTSAVIQTLLAPQDSVSEIMRSWQSQDLQVATSPALLAELAAALSAPPLRQLLSLSAPTIELFVDRFRQMTFVLEPQSQLEGLPPDLEDNQAIRCAFDSGARYLVTLDERVLALHSYQSVITLSPDTFAASLEQILSHSTF